MTSFVLPSEIQIQQKINQNMLINVLLWSVDELDHTKGVIRIRKSKDRQHNDKKKRTKNDLINTIQKTKDRATLKTGVNCMP